MGAFRWWLDHEGGAVMKGMSMLIRETPESFLLSAVRMQWDNDYLQPGRELPPEPDLRDTLILVLQPPELWEINFPQLFISQAICDILL